MNWSGALRLATPDDMPFMREMLFEAFFWRGTEERPPLGDFRRDERFQLLLERDWGRPGDSGLIAVADDGEPLGAAFYRLYTNTEHFHGFIDEATPELAIGVRADARGRGVGTALMRGLLDLARREGYAKLSLSVIPDNPSRRIYERVGFRKVGVSGVADTMVAILNERTLRRGKR